VTPRLAAVAVVVAATLAAACDAPSGTPATGAIPAPASTTPGVAAPTESAGMLPGMPRRWTRTTCTRADRPSHIAALARHDRPLVYVPNVGSGTVSVIDPYTDKVIRTVRVGAGPEHVVPACDLRTLWVNNDAGNSLTPIDPVAGSFGKPVPVDDPDNLYFTPDRRFAVVMSEARRQIVFRDPHTMAVKHVLPVGCDGLNHAGFCPDGRYFIVTCEFSGDLLKIDTARQRIVQRMHLSGQHPMPWDIKIAPDGRTWYVADMQSGGAWELDGDTLTGPVFVPTGDGAHGLYPSRDSRYL
jgi:YVTN family beta-propeller protein